MERAGSYILTDKKRSQLYYAVRQYEKEHKDHDEKFMLISKYHERLWFQQIWRATYDELLYEMRRLAMAMERLELSINECKTALYFHQCAIEYLAKQPKPYIDINLLTTELKQTELF